MSDSSQNRQTVSEQLARIWEEKKGVLFARLDVLEDAVSALARGTLTEELSSKAAIEAHKLAGSLGTFGFGDGSRVARTLEETFGRRPRPEECDQKQLVRFLAELREGMEQLPARLKAGGL